VLCGRSTIRTPINKWTIGGGPDTPLAWASRLGFFAILITIKTSKSIKSK
jgi:hypothetical protein